MLSRRVRCGRARRRLLPRERGTREGPRRALYDGEGSARDSSRAGNPPGPGRRPYKGSHRATRAEAALAALTTCASVNTVDLLVTVSPFYASYAPVGKDALGRRNVRMAR